MRTYLRFILGFTAVVLVAGMVWGQTTIYVDDSNVWTEYSSNPLFTGGSTPGVDRAYYPIVLKVGSTYHMWYGDGSNTLYLSSTNPAFTGVSFPGTVCTGLTAGAYHPRVLHNASGWTVGGTFYAGPFLMYWTIGPSWNTNPRVSHSADGISWTDIGPCTGVIGAGAYYMAYNFAVLYEGSSTWKAYADNGWGWIQYFTSTNGKDWTGVATNILGSPYQAWEVVQNNISPNIIKVDDYYVIFYSSGATDNNQAIGMAVSTNGQNFKKSRGNPIFTTSGSPPSWRNERTYTPWVFQDGTTWRMYFSGKSTSGVYSVGLATNTGLFWLIQDAINAATSTTINVAAGTYNENIVINIPLTVQGAGKATTFVNGVGPGADISVVYITAAGNVTLTGFTITNPATTAPGDLRFGVLTNSPSVGVTYTITGNKVVGTNVATNVEDYGIYGRDGGKENLVVTNNVVTMTGSNNIVVETHQGTTDISSNILDAGCKGVDPIFIMTHSGLAVSNLQKVSKNQIDMGTGTIRANGITFNAVADYYSKPPGSSNLPPGKFLANSIEISDNNIFNLKDNRRGIGLWVDTYATGGATGDIISPLVTNNIITYVSSPFATGSFGIYTLGLVTNSNIVNNTIKGADLPFKERAWNGTIATGTKLNFNNLLSVGSSFTGVLTDRTSGALDATNNWWGASDGPGTLGPGSGTKVSSYVTYAPWITGLAYSGGPQPGTSVNLQATLYNSVPGTAGAGASIFFSLDGAPKGSANTDASGVATLNIGPVPAGVYTVKAFVGPECTPIEALLPVYDPSAGFVTGGGWITSPPGAYTADPLKTGKATFGFVSKYVKGKTLPTGETEFQFQMVNFKFNSDSYQWLVVSGAKAQYKGTGTVNGASGYGFLLTATDGQINGGGGVDKFRIKIWNGSVVYDNASGPEDIDLSPQQAIGGGSIVIHKTASANIIGEDQAQAMEAKFIPVEFALFESYPNPFNPTTNIRFDIPTASVVTLKVYDVLGREVATVVDGEFRDAGRYDVRFDGAQFGSGVYFYKISAGSFQSIKKMVMVK